jgi:O-antigen/teichoic acid export membrane protein
MNEKTGGSPLSRLLDSRIIQSGLILSIVGFLTGIGNYAFQMVMARHLPDGEFGYMNATVTFVGMLGLPLGAATYAVTHYLARFQAGGEEARLQGLLAGCRRFLFHLTLVGTVLAIVAVKPLGEFFKIPRTSLVLISAFCVVAGLWGGFATALCQGLSWFKRLAFIGLLTVALRLGFGWAAVTHYPRAESVVLASAVMLLANLVLLFWRKELPGKVAGISPWDRQFAQYLIVGAACVGGNFCFQQGDILVANRYFTPLQLSAYSGTQKLAGALWMVVGPLLTVLFTHRSGARTAGAVAEQFKLLGLYAVGLLAGAAGLMVLRGLAVRIMFGHPAPTAAALMGPLALTMVFVGLLQALGTWALASSWLKVSLLYGALGLAYWLVLLVFGKTLPNLLVVMPVAAGTALAVLFGFWFITLRGSDSGAVPER